MLTTHWLHPFLLLLALLASTHALIFRVRWRPTPIGSEKHDKQERISLRFAQMSSKKFWKRIDYVWLTLATVGLFAAFGAIRRNDAEESLRRVTHSLETTLLTILDEKSKMSIRVPPADVLEFIGNCR